MIAKVAKQSKGLISMNGGDQKSNNKSIAKQIQNCFTLLEKEERILFRANTEKPKF
jgi:hypothetical protein